MADGKAALGQLENSQKAENVQAAAGARVDFPLEGESRWVAVMRVLAIGTLLAILVLGGVYHFLAGDRSFAANQQLLMIFSGIVLLLLIEYFIFLKVVIPRQAAYGRFLLHRDKVEFFPLTALGLGVRKDSVKVQINSFIGITTSRVTDKKGRVSYAAFLIHGSDKGKSIKVRSFSEPVEAEKFALVLGKAVNLNVASGLVQKKKRRAL